MRSRVTLVAMAAALPLALPSAALSAGADFSGKTITALVGFSAGGPVDNFARIVAAHMAKYLPGNPTVIVQNKPGAGGVVAANYLYNVAKKDGSVFLVTIAPFTNQFIGGRKVKFDTQKFFWLGALNYSNTIYVRGDLGIKSALNIGAARSQIVIGGLRPNSSRDLYMKSFLEAAGYRKYKYVIGYRGTAPIRAALLRGEVNFSTESAVALAKDLAPYVKDGSVVPLVQTGLTRNGKLVPDPRIPHVPLIGETVVALKGEAVKKTTAFRALNLIISMTVLGRGVFAPPGVDHAAGLALREAVGKLNGDAQFQKSARRLNGGTKMTLIDGATAQNLAKKITNLVKTEPAAHKYLEDMAKKKTR